MLTQRSQEKELLDLGPEYYTEDEYYDCMKKLYRVNQLLGFFHSTVKILKKLPSTSSLLDVGCGGGLFALNLSQIFPHIKFKGVDISREAIDLAHLELKNWNKPTNISFELLNEPNLNVSTLSSDVVLSTLVCHHLNDDELVSFLQQMLKISNKTVIINDLHRHPLAYYIYKIISPILFRNRLITYDGLISIRRSFTRNDWIHLLSKANIHHYKIQWCFPFRWRVILWKK